MTSSVTAAIDRLNAALTGLEKAVDASSRSATLSTPQLELPRNEREVNRKVAARLDQTIERLELLLKEA